MEHLSLLGAHCVGQNIIYVAECLALRGGLWMENLTGFKRIIVEGDSKLVIECICGVFNAPWRLKTILDDICRLAGFSEDISWMHVFRGLIS